MDKFWEWMNKKGYAEKHFTGLQVIPPDQMDRLVHEFTKQMLIGYMIEYIYEKTQYIHIEDPHDVYEHLKDEIENL